MHIDVCESMRLFGDVGHVHHRGGCSGNVLIPTAWIVDVVQTEPGGWWAASSGCNWHGGGLLYSFDVFTAFLLPEAISPHAIL